MTENSENDLSADVKVHSLGVGNLKLSDNQVPELCFCLSDRFFEKIQFHFYYYSQFPFALHGRNSFVWKNITHGWMEGERSLSNQKPHTRDVNQMTVHS